MKPDSQPSIANQTSPTKTLFAICTRNRPEMLGHCLSSVLNMEIPDSLDLQVVVIDNSVDLAMHERNRETAGRIPTNLPVHILHESRPGIPFARNRAIEMALEGEADALVFLDDDQTVPHDWLAVVASVAQEETADAVKSGVTFVFEGEAKYAEHFAAWNGVLPKNNRTRGIRYVSTNGVWISARLFREIGLRFDEKRDFLGGTDTAFFLEAYDRGARLIATDEVFAQEIVLSNKQNLSWLTRRNFRGGVGRATLRLNDKSRLYYLTSGISQALLYYLLALILIWRQKPSMRYYLRAVRALGIAWGAMGGQFGEYKRIVGR